MCYMNKTVLPTGRWLFKSGVHFGIFSTLTVDDLQLFLFDSERLFRGLNSHPPTNPVSHQLSCTILTFSWRCAQRTWAHNDVMFSLPWSDLSGGCFSTLPASVLGQEMFQKAGKGSNAGKPQWHDEPSGPVNDLARSILILFSKASNFDLKFRSDCDAHKDTSSLHRCFDLMFRAMAPKEFGLATFFDLVKSSDWATHNEWVCYSKLHRDLSSGSSHLCGFAWI